MAGENVQSVVYSTGTNKTVKASGGKVYGVHVSTAQAVATPNVLEITDGSGGDSIWKQSTAVTTAGKTTHDFNLHGRRCPNGIYLTITQTYEQVVVFFE